MNFERIIGDVAAMNLNLSSPPNLCFCSMTIPSIP